MPSTWTLAPCLPTIAERAMQKSQGPALPFQRLPWHETHVHVHTLHVGRNTAPQHMVNTCKTTSSVAQTRSPRQRWTRCPKRAGGQGICIQSNKSRKTRNADGGHATLGHPSSALFGSVAMRVSRHRGSLRKAQSHVGIRQTWIPIFRRPRTWMSTSCRADGCLSFRRPRLATTSPETFPVRDVGIVGRAGSHRRKHISRKTRMAQLESMIQAGAVVVL